MKNVYQLPFTSLQTAFTIFFLVRNNFEMNDLIKWIEEYHKSENPCFEYDLELKEFSTSFIRNTSPKNINLEKDDF